jgi:endo-1,4-beta-xylanase
MKSRIVSFCTVLAVMAVVLGLAGCPAASDDNSDKKEENGPVVIPVTGIQLEDKANYETIPVSNQEKLEYTIIPEDATNQQVSWSSDTPGVASVDEDGMVNFHTQGTATITVTTEDGGFSDTITVTVVQPLAAEGIALVKDSLTLTLFAKERLTYTMVPARASNKTVTWASDNPAVVSVAPDGTVTALTYTTGGSSTDITEAIGTATITVTSDDGGFTDTITVTTTLEGTVDIMDLAPLKDRFSRYFLIGNIFDPPGAWYAGDVSAEPPYAITNERLLRHYNVVTPQNNMKPSYMCDRNTPGEYNEANIAIADRMVNGALASDFFVVGHTLLWHSQLPAWQGNLRTDDTPKETALEWMKEYVSYIVSHFSGRIYAWDILNEAFPDSVSANGNWRTSMREGASGNPWFMKIGADFVYEGYLAARLADPEAVLYYNDYSMDNVGKATMVRDMVRDVNAQYLASGDKPAGEAPGRLLIEGIGMQSHHNTGIQANAVRNTLDLFRPLGVRISISEMDVLSQNWSDYDTQKPPTNIGRLNAANLYGQYFQVFLDNATIIERVSFWGISDNRSWRPRGFPLIFDGNGKAKPAYYKMIGALER